MHIDYDALALAPTSDSPTGFDQTRFSVSDNYILDASRKLVDELRKVIGHVALQIFLINLYCLCFK